MVDTYEHLWSSPRAQSSRELCGLGGVGRFSRLCLLPTTGTICIPRTVGGQMGFCIPKLHISLSGAVLGNLKMQYHCHQLEEDTEPE